MVIKDVIREMTKSSRRKAALALIDVILSSKKSHEIDSEEAKTFLRLWQEDKFTTINGLEFLLNIAKKIEPEKAASKLNELEFSKLAELIGG